MTIQVRRNLSYCLLSKILLFNVPDFLRILKDILGSCMNLSSCWFSVPGGHEWIEMCFVGLSRSCIV